MTGDPNHRFRMENVVQLELDRSFETWTSDLTGGADVDAGYDQYYDSMVASGGQMSDAEYEAYAHAMMTEQHGIEPGMMASDAEYSALLNQLAIDGTATAGSAARPSTARGRRTD